MSSISAIAYGAGPGSFTGLRIALSMAQGLAFGLEVPLVPVCSLQALALESINAGVCAHQIICLLDARMGELYWASYEAVEGKLSVMVEPKLEAIESAQASILNLSGLQGTFCVGPGSAYLVESAFQSKGVQFMTIEPNARAVAALGRQEFLSSGGIAVDQAELTYLRNEVSWNKRKRIRQREGV